MQINEGLPGPLQDAFEALPGLVPAQRHGSRAPGYSPGSPDIGLVTRLMRDIRSIWVPADAGPLSYADRIWRPYLRVRRDARNFAGTTLACTDWAPENILVTGGRAWVARWTRPALAAPWVDAACLVLELIVHGHDPRDAEALAAREVTAFALASPAAIDMFARASRKMHEDPANANPRKRELAAAACQWSGYRYLRERAPAAPGPAGRRQR